MLSRQDRQLGGLWGAVIGDALGVPVEFKSRDQIARHPVTGLRGYGTHHQPPGTWSDDSSLLICTAESLLSGFDTQDMAGRFVRWLDEGYWTPWGKVFDVGGATRRAIHRLRQGVAPEQAGGEDEQSNGNGSLMRILPIALRFADASPEKLVEYAHRASGLTHRHPRSQMACGIYCLIIAALLKDADPSTACLEAIQWAQTIYQSPPYAGELPHMARFLSGPPTVEHIAEADIRSTGYVLDTLEASVWCLLNTNSFEQAVLRAVNLGDDTDTTGTVTGGLAGVHYGLGAIPREWLAHIARRDDLSRLFEAFALSMP